MTLNPLQLLSDLLKKCGQDTYVQRVEFAAHLGFSISSALTAILVTKWIALGMVVWAMYDEFIADKHWMIFKPSSFQQQRYQGDPLDWQDCLWDLGSKALIPAIVFVAMLVM